MAAAPSHAQVEWILESKNKPAVPSKKAKINASSTLIRPEGKGRDEVRFISTSEWRSITWLKVLALPVIKNPPMESSQMVSVSTFRWVAHRYAIAAEKTTRKERRIFTSCA